MDLLTGIFVIILASIAGDTIAKIFKARSLARQGGVKREELDQLKRQLQEQAAALVEAEQTVREQSLQVEELHERLEFAERMLLEVRQRPSLGAGSDADPKP